MKTEGGVTGKNIECSGCGKVIGWEGVLQVKKVTLGSYYEKDGMRRCIACAHELTEPRNDGAVD
jgi:hypothetical protein